MKNCLAFLFILFLGIAVNAGEWLKVLEVGKFYQDSVTCYLPFQSVSKSSCIVWFTVPLTPPESDRITTATGYSFLKPIKAKELISFNFKTGQVAIFAVTINEEGINHTIKDPVWFYPPPESLYAHLYNFCHDVINRQGIYAP